MGRAGWDGVDEPIFMGFASSGAAVVWALEVLRRRRLPRLSPLWREACGDGGPDLRRGSGDVTLGLPDDGIGRLGLALRVQGVLAGLPPLMQRRLALWAMGEGRGPLTCVQLAAVWGCSAKTAWRWLQAALDATEPGLVQAGVVRRVVVPRRDGDDKIKKAVKANEFYGKECDFCLTGDMGRGRVVKDARHV